MKSALDALAEYCGIESTYDDAFGRPHRTSSATRRELLRAMRLAAENEAEAQATLDDLQHREWTEPPPVIVAERDAAGQIHIPVTAEQGSPAVEWTVNTEDGDIVRGRSDFAGMRLVESRVCEGRVLERRQMTCPGLPLGYHRLSTRENAPQTTLIVTPGRCWLPEEARSGEGLWGIAAQLYLLRTEHNWGIGDFTDLRELFQLGIEHGCNVVGVNPLHALFLDKPEEASPYSPLSRYLLNVLNIDVEAIPEVKDSAELQAAIAEPAFQQQLAACRDATEVQYGRVTTLKREMLERAFAAFEASSDPERQKAFSRFMDRQDELFRTHCVFLALRRYFAETEGGKADCGDWPEEFQHSDSPSVTQFAQEHPNEVRFQMWMQWIADTQLGDASSAAAEMRIGLYRDMAVGASASGAEVWSNPQAMLSNAEIGAPPDTWNPAGQNWAIRPFAPRALREEAYRSFIELLRANMRFAGAIRLDHAMSLQRLYLIPTGATAHDGGYVRYPMDDLVGILALESQRNRCLVIGEDLGTVSPGFRERMAAAHILSYRLLLLEVDNESESKKFVPARDYPALALATPSSHDLPTLRGWWSGADIDTKENIGLYQNDRAAAQARVERERDKQNLLDALRTEDLLPADADPDWQQVVDAAHAFLARTPALLTMVQIDDLTGELQQVNQPGTMPDQYPGWRRRLSRSLQELHTDPQLKSLDNSMSSRTAHATR